jgi:hypothetical protein
MEGAVKQKETVKGKQKENKETIGKRKRESALSSSDSDEDFKKPILVESEEGNDDDAECHYCMEVFSTDRREKEWIACIRCHQWCHEECSGADDYQKFLSAFCLDD